MLSSGFAQIFKPTKVSRGSDPAAPTPHKETERSSDGR
jgi:hypothetical protein